MNGPARQLLVLSLACLTLLAAPVNAQKAGDSSAVDAIPRLRPAPGFGGLQGRPLTRIRVSSRGSRWKESPRLTRVRVGDPLSGELVRRAMHELVETGRFADVRAEVEALGSGVLLRLVVLPRRIAVAVRVDGSTLDETETLRAAEIEAGGEVTGPELPRIARRVKQHYAKHGYPRAQVSVVAVDTDDRMRVVVRVEIRPGAPLVLAARRFHLAGGKQSLLRPLVRYYGAELGDRVDEELLLDADEVLEAELRARGWHDATVRHWVVPGKRGSTLHVSAQAGAFYRYRFEGNRRFDAAQLVEALKLDDAEERASGALRSRLVDFYVSHGFLDAKIDVQVRGRRTAPIREIVFVVRENRPVRVVVRQYPCLTGGRDADQVGSEIDSFLSEELPSTGILGSVDPAEVDRTLGPTRTNTGSRVPPYQPNPWQIYERRVYERAVKHLQDLYRSEGYLSARVGPVAVLRRRCRADSPPGRCIPRGPRTQPPTSCRYDSRGVPVDELPPPASISCVPSRGVQCEPDIALHIPVKLGPRSMLYDLSFAGNKVLVEKRLEEAAALPLGEPVSQIELQAARRRLLAAYAEEGFAYAEIETELDLSADHSRARVRFVVSERERVIVRSIVIRGAVKTSEGLIRRRIALQVGKPYRVSWARRTEEQLATLGVFSSVSVGLDNSGVPAKEKSVIVTVTEMPPQYVEPRIGFGTGEGIRGAFEYGHRNLGGQAIALRLRFQASFLPSFLLLERSVRTKIEALPLVDRLERSNTVTLELPEIGLGPLFRLAITGAESNDLARAFRFTRRAGIVAIIYRPNRRFSAQIGPSVELNDAEILGFDDQSRDQFRTFLRTNPIPEGQSVAIAQRIAVAWDRRNNPFGATRGTYVSQEVEHVRALPLGDSEERSSDFLRFSARVAGYVPLDDDGLALAVSLGGGYVQHLIPDRQTYPDRLFFFGGIDDVRGFVQDSVIPEDVAQQLLDEPPDVQADLLREVVIPGGNVLINPRMELRIPLGDVFGTALFIDSGNLWLDPAEVNPLQLRYAVGSGLRATTPIGPLAFDYGINLDRRPWENFGAFHFSLGLF